MNNTDMSVTHRARKSKYALKGAGTGVFALLCGGIWLCADISAQQTPAHAMRKAAPRYVRQVQTTTPNALNMLLRQATQAVNARDTDALKLLVTPDTLASFDWMRKKTTKHWTGEALVLPAPPSGAARNAAFDTSPNTASNTFSSVTPASSPLYLAIFHAWHTCESDGDHIHRIEPGENGGWRLGAEIPETETGGYRVRDHDLTVSIDPAQHTTAIKDTIRVEASGTPLLPVCLLRLSDDFKVSSLTSKNVPVAYAQAGGVIAVTPPVLDASRAFPLTLTYSGRVLHQGSDYINSQEATLNSYWYPHIARLPATSTVTTTAPPRWTPIAQGEKTQEKRHSNGSLTVTYRNDVPNCFFTVDMGPYTTTSRKVNGRTLSVCFLTPNARAAQACLDLLGKSLAFYDKEFAPFPYTHYEVVQTRGPFSGALEAYSFATFSMGTMGPVIPHELSHTWWGGIVPCTYTRSMWNESFAQYSSDLFARLNPQIAGQVDVEESPVGKRRQYGKGFDGVTMENAHDTSDIDHIAVGYGKGALVLRVLEEQIGLEKMRGSIKAFLAAHPKGEAAEWPEFERAVNKTTGQDYGWFFDQWTKRTGLPRIRFANVSSRRNENGYVVEGDIVQEGEPYRLRIPLRLQTGNEKPLNQDLDVSGPKTHFQLNAASPPTRLMLDPENVLPLATTTEQASVGF